MSCDNVPHNGEVVPRRRRRPRRGAGPGLRRLGRATTVAFPNAHGRPHRAGDRRPRAADHPRRVRDRRRLAGVLRGLPPVGGRGPLPAGRPAFEEVGVAVRRRRDALGDDEDPHPERRARDHRLSLRPDGHPLRPRGDGRTSWCAPSCRRSSARRSSRSCRRCRAPTSTATSAGRGALPEPEDRRHHPPALPRRLEPAAEVHHPVDRRPPGRGLPVAGLALESALWCRYCYGTTDSGKVDRAERPELGPAAGAGPRRQGRPAGLARMRDIYGAAADAPAFRDAFAAALAALWADGTAATLKRYLARERTWRPRRTWSSSTATACWSTASRSRCGCCSTRWRAAGLELDPEEAHAAVSRPQPRQHARDPRRRLRPDALGRRARGDAPAALRRVPRRAAADPAVAETLDALPSPFCVASSSQPERIGSR